MYLYIIIIVASALILIGLWIYLDTKRQNRRINAIVSGQFFKNWNYSKEEWIWAVENEFTWVTNKEMIGQVYINVTPPEILITNGKQQRLYELEQGGRIITYATFINDNPLGLLKIRVRWKKLVATGHGDDEEEYYKEDYRIPVPMNSKEQAERVANFLNKYIEANIAAVQNVLPRTTSILGRDTEL